MFNIIPFEFACVKDFLSEYDKEILYYELTKKLKSRGKTEEQNLWQSNNLLFEDLFSISEQSYFLCKKYLDMIKSEDFQNTFNINLNEEYKINVDVIILNPEFEGKVHFGSHDRILSTYIDITPKKNLTEDFIFLYQKHDLENHFKKIKNTEVDFISFSPKKQNNTWHKISNKSKTDHKIVIFLKLEKNLDKNTIILKDFKYDTYLAKNTLYNGLIMKEKNFVIYAKYKCGTRSLKEWYEKIVNKNDYICTLDENNNTIKNTFELYNKVLECDLHYFVVRNPYERFFSGLLQTKIIGPYDIYDRRLGITLPFSLLREEDLCYIFKNVEIYRKYMLSDPHLTPFYESFYLHLLHLSKKNKKIKIIQLENLENIISYLKQETGENFLDILRFEIKGKKFPTEEFNKGMDFFYKVVSENKTKINFFKNIEDILEKEYFFYNKILSDYAT